MSDAETLEISGVAKAVSARVDSSVEPSTPLQRLIPGSLLDLFRALGDATRLRILALLDVMELAVGEIAQLLDQSQPRVSRHVRLLEEVGLVVRRREGSWVFVRLATDGPGAAALAQLRHLPPNACEQAARASDHNRLAAIQADREETARRYFDAHARDWDALRSLHAPERDVERAITAILHGRDLGHLIDIGTGTGRMVELLSPQATCVTAIDRSPEMLRLARSRLAHVKVPVDLIQADFAKIPLHDGAAQTAVLHQVLHYARAPELVFEELARVLAPGGVVLIIDFAPHEREELRREAAHARLGFTDSQIRSIMADAHIALEDIQTLAGGPLTVKLWLGRRRRNRIAPLLNGKSDDE